MERQGESPTMVPSTSTSSNPAVSVLRHTDPYGPTPGDVSVIEAWTSLPIREKAAIAIDGASTVVTFLALVVAHRALKQTARQHSDDLAFRNQADDRRFREDWLLSDIREDAKNVRVQLLVLAHKSETAIADAVASGKSVTEITTLQQDSVREFQKHVLPYKARVAVSCGGMEESELSELLRTVAEELEDKWSACLSVNGVDHRKTTLSDLVNEWSRTTARALIDSLRHPTTKIVSASPIRAHT
jgi:hypothetical protein